MLFRTAGLLVAMFAMGTLVSASALADESFTYGTINAQKGYHSTSSGDPLIGQGARVTIWGEPAAEAPFGGAIYATGAHGWANKVARLSAVIDSADPGIKPAIWLRADGGDGKPIEMVSSAGLAMSADGHLSIELRIPAQAEKIAFGAITRGPGKATLERLRLEEEAGAHPGNDASAEQVYEAALKIVLARAYWSKNLRQDQQQSRPQLSQEPGTGYQAEKPIRALLRELGDSHSFHLNAQSAQRMSESGGTPDAAEVKLLDDGVGYVSIPAFNGTSATLEKAFAEEVGGKLRGLRGEARCGWVVDLRNNRGGNMWPMISALGIFFGEDRLGGFKRSDGTITWTSIHSPRVITVPGVSEAQEANVAVLLGPRTASSGEAVAVAFIKRANTRSFGAPTSGLASGNARFKLPDGSVIYLTEAVDVDRSGQEIDKRVVPDVRLPDEVVSNSGVPQEALNWLESSCGR